MYLKIDPLYIIRMSISLVYSLKMPACSACGKQLRHLYEDHADLTKQLDTELGERPNFRATKVPTGYYLGKISGIDLTDFIKTYYTWELKLEQDTDENTFEPNNIISRGLLRLQELTEDMLPFGTQREPDNQISLLTESLCCLRMFQCDPSFSVN